MRKGIAAAASLTALLILGGCSAQTAGQEGSSPSSSQGSSSPVSTGLTQEEIGALVAKPTPEEPSFPEERYRSGSANEFVGYNYFDDVSYLSNDTDNRIAFVKKNDRFFAPMYLYGVAEDFERYSGFNYTFDNVPEGFEIRETAGYLSVTEVASATMKYDTQYGDECLIVDRSMGDELYVASATALADIQVYGAYCLLPVNDDGTFGGIVSGSVEELQRVSRSDSAAFDNALSSLGLTLHEGRDSDGAVRATLIAGATPQTVTVSTTSNHGETLELDRYFTVTPRYHNPTDSGVQVGIKEQTDTYAVLDLTNVDPGRYLVPSYGEDYMLIEVW